MFLQATMDDGSKIVSEFTKLGHVQRYITQVLAGGRPFNAWAIVSDTHPESGDKCLMRTRNMISGHKIKSIEIVRRMAGAPEHSMAPQSFVPVPLIQRGQYGSWKAPLENTPAGAVAGVEYPIKRDAVTLQRYVVLKANPEQRFSLDAAEFGPLDGDDDQPNSPATDDDEF